MPARREYRSVRHRRGAARIEKLRWPSAVILKHPPPVPKTRGGEWLDPETRSPAADEVLHDLARSRRERDAEHRVSRGDEYVVELLNGSDDRQTVRRAWTQPTPDPGRLL